MSKRIWDHIARKKMFFIGFMLMALLFTGSSLLFVHTTSNSITNSQTTCPESPIGKKLIDAQVTREQGGAAAQSGIQYPHVQTDLDVGAAGSGMTLLSLSQTACNTSQRTAYLNAAKRNGDFLLAVAQKTKSGIQIPDYADPNGDVSKTHFNSLQDGAPGIALFLYHLSQLTHESTYADSAKELMTQTMANAQVIHKNSTTSEYTWIWADTAPTHQTGVGEGLAGIIYAFDQFYLLTNDPTYLTYAKGGGAYLASLMNTSGAIPETSEIGDTTYNTGVVSGQAGYAYVFLQMYQTTKDTQYLTDAQKILTWLTNHKLTQTNGAAWPISIDPTANTDTLQATGVEEGDAGIGYVFLQAYNITKDKVYLDTARQAGDYLVAHAVVNNNGDMWYEDANETSSQAQIHTGMNSGAGGIGIFLWDLYETTRNASYQQTAQHALIWLDYVIQTYGNYESYFFEDAQLTGNIPNETSSWHWSPLIAQLDLSMRIAGKGNDNLIAPSL